MKLCQTIVIRFILFSFYYYFYIDKNRGNVITSPLFKELSIGANVCPFYRATVVFTLFNLWFYPRYYRHCMVVRPVNKVDMVPPL